MCERCGRALGCFYHVIKRFNRAQGVRKGSERASGGDKGLQQTGKRRKGHKRNARGANVVKHIF